MPDKTFEQKFAQMAEVHVKDKVPSLMEYWVGFQLVYKSDDEKNATGIMAFVVDKLWIYIPVIFIKGELKGDSVLYIQNVDLCIPAQDNWINTLKEKGMSFLGSVVQDRDQEKTDFESSDDISIPVEEFTVKESSENSLVDAEDVKRMFTKKACNKTFVDKLASMGDQAVLTFANTIMNSTDMANAVLEHHSPDELEKIADMVHEISVKYTEVPEKKKLTFVEGLDDKNASELDEKEKKLLVKNGVFVKDARDNTSKVFTAASTDAKFTNPDEEGGYSVLMSDGTYRNFYIIMTGDKSCALVDKKKFCKKPTSEVFCRQEADINPDFEDATFRKLSNALKGEGKSVIIKQGRKAYTLTNSRIGPEDSTRMMVRCGHTDVEPVFTGSEGNLNIHHQTLVIPSNTKMLRCEEMEYDERPELGDLNTVAAALQMNDQYTPLQIKSRKETGVTVETGTEQETFNDKTSALKCLTQDFGIYAGQAQNMLKDAEREGSEKYFVKLADQDEGVVNPLKGKQVQMSEEQITQPNVQGLLPGKVVEDLTRAAETGLSEVFDTSVFQSLLQSAGVSDFKQEFIVDMVRGMDSAARMLLLLYWNYEMFEERYDNKLDELEEKLKELFKTSGDVVLFIKEKTESLPDSGESVWGMLSEDIGV